MVAGGRAVARVVVSGDGASNFPLPDLCKEATTGHPRPRQTPAPFVLTLKKLDGTLLRRRYPHGASVLDAKRDVVVGWSLRPGRWPLRVDTGRMINS